MAIGFLHYLKVLQRVKSKQMVFMLGKVGHVGVSGSYLPNFFGGSFEEISLIQSYGELNDVSFETRLKCLK